MTPDELRARVAGLRQWGANGKRAPHKPLLLLYALARFAEGTERLPFNDVEGPLVQLLDDFGPSSPNHRPFPFWRLTTDGVWDIKGDADVRRTASGDMFLTDARERNPVGGLSPEVVRILRQRPELVAEAASALLDAHFPATIHEDILDAVGLDLEAVAPTSRPKKRRRDPTFRANVIRSYGYRCAVCGFETRIGNTLVGIDAAHVRWHQAGGYGVDDVTNGVALCALHHRLMDRGAFTLAEASSKEIVVEVAEDAHGGDGFRRWLLDFHGRPIAAPARSGDRVAEPSLAWHRREVFRGPARERE
ncbi:phosphorothioated DNA-binding restriction endonuclease [Rubrivirga sp.]|uniref:phosphorothioated DNA-binding restriction endonuclease n=1 Tax=Rubrivirga sp. TaxID=1885344 RepID=UPI003B520F62